MKVIALYLPQFHETKENNEWWGIGYTEWNAVRQAKSFFSGHSQPKKPLNGNYYDLSDPSGSIWRWQAETAKQYGVDGFCIYHYWFKNGKQMLQSPMEILLSKSDINIEYCICWANEPWKRTWYGNNSEILIEQEYGDEQEWIDHFMYLLPFFKDKRYMKKENRPIVTIYRTAAIEKLNEMQIIWSKLAVENGFDGIYLISAKTAFAIDTRKELFNAYFEFEPAHTLHYRNRKIDVLNRAISRGWRKVYNIFNSQKKVECIEDISKIYRNMDFPVTDMKIKTYPGICPRWDNTPRKQHKGTYFKNSSPLLFEEKLRSIYNQSSNDDYVFINAWNEWGEGAYLEPDEEAKSEYLESIKKALEGREMKEEFLVNLDGNMLND